MKTSRIGCVWLIWFLTVAVVLCWPHFAWAVEVKVISGSESAARAVDCRRMLIGPGVNQPDPHPGYAGFVGWDAPLRLRDGTLLVSFSTGYWHASPPTPLRVAPDTLAQWKKLGMPTDVEAPTGGRAMLIRSADDGRTWSKPQTIIDTPWDDRSPALAGIGAEEVVTSVRQIQASRRIAIADLLSLGHQGDVRFSTAVIVPFTLGMGLQAMAREPFLNRGSPPLE